MRSTRGRAASLGCDNFGKPGLNIVGHGWFVTKSGRRRRYRCTVCGGTLSTTTGTAYRGLRCSRREFDQVASLRVEGVSMSATAPSDGPFPHHHRAMARASLDSCRRASITGCGAISTSLSCRRMHAARSSAASAAPCGCLRRSRCVPACGPGSVLGRRSHRNTKAAINDVILRGRRVGFPLTATDGVEY